jgi:hypothetical protein
MTPSPSISQSWAGTGGLTPVGLDDIDIVTIHIPVSVNVAGGKKMVGIDFIYSA